MAGRERSERPSHNGPPAPVASTSDGLWRVGLKRGHLPPWDSFRGWEPLLASRHPSRAREEQCPQCPPQRTWRLSPPCPFFLTWTPERVSVWWPPRQVWLGWARGAEWTRGKENGRESSLSSGFFEVPESVSELGESLEVAGGGGGGRLPLSSESRSFLDGMAFEFGLTLLVLIEAFSAAVETNSAWPVVVR